jgi:hypothetical protein
MNNILQPGFIRHPVTQAEFKYQRHVIDSSRAGRFWILLAFLMMIPALLISLALTAAFFIGLPLPSVIVALPGNVPPPFSTLGIGLLFVMNIAMYVVLTMITYGLGINSIQREKEGRTWDNLVLTGVSAWQLVLGKWWATLWALWGDHLMVLLLRLGFACWLVTETARIALADPATLPWMDTIISGRLYMLAILLLIAVYTIIDAGFTTALGVLSAVTEIPAVVMTTLSIAVRLVVSAGMLVAPVMLGSALRPSTEAAYGIGGVIGALLLVALVWAMLWLASQAAARNYAMSL